jgi:hypothetical protein
MGFDALLALSIVLWPNCSNEFGAKLEAALELGLA